jgi:hypothetical protein
MTRSEILASPQIQVLNSIPTGLANPFIHNHESRSLEGIQETIEQAHP